MRKIWKTLGVIVGSVLALWLMIFLKPVGKRPDWPFYREKDPDLLVIAHRGGKGIAPEGTIAAFDQAVELGVDILEYDIHMTSDERLVVIHDPSVDRTTNGSGLINELTLEEVQRLDAGYHFQDEAGNYSFRNQGVYIPTVEEIFTRYPQMRQLIEIKDTNNPELYEEIIQKLWSLIVEYGMEEEVMIGSFDHEINERFDEVSAGVIPIGAGEQAVRSFVEKHVPYLNGLAKTNFDSMQLPIEQEGHDLTKRNIIRSAQKRNVSIYYWTINEAEEMRELIEKGADGLITDYPDRALKVKKEMKQRFVKSK